MAWVLILTLVGVGQIRVENIPSEAHCRQTAQVLTQGRVVLQKNGGPPQELQVDAVKWTCLRGLTP